MLGVSDKRADDGLSEAERDRLHRLKRWRHGPFRKELVAFHLLTCPVAVNNFSLIQIHSKILSKFEFTAVTL